MQSEPLKASDLKRFWSKVNKRGPIPKHVPKIGRCWEWTGSQKGIGYGQFSCQGGSVRAHRWIYSAKIGVIKNGLWVLHRCDNPICVRPSHLFQGTQSENILDCSRKGRWANRHSRRTSCMNGHEYKDGTWRWQYDLKSNRTFRVCRICNRKFCKTWRDKQRN